MANSIKVVARFRPQNRIELDSGGKPIVSFNADDSCTLDVLLLAPCCGSRCSKAAQISPG